MVLVRSPKIQSDLGVVSYVTPPNVKQDFVRQKNIKSKLAQKMKQTFSREKQRPINAVSHKRENIRGGI